MNFNVAQDRRRFYLSHGLRKKPRGGGGSLLLLMALPREVLPVNVDGLFGDIRAVVIGGVATRAYAPERNTKDIDFLVEHERFDEAVAQLTGQGWEVVESLFFPNASLGLYGKALRKDGQIIDLIATDQAWGEEALQCPSRDQTGLSVIGLPYLVLMKLDSARGIDQGDLTRMLGRVSEEGLDEIVAIVERYAHDPQAADDVQQYALLGRMEWETNPHRDA